MKTIAWLLIYMVLSGCSFADMKESDTSIIGGNTETSYSKFNVVALTTYSSMQNGKSYCTGTLIDRDLVLTAAHCVTNDGYNLSIDSFLVCYGPRVGTNCKWAKWVHWHEAYQPYYTTAGNAPANDIALVKVDGMFENVPAIPIAQDSEINEGDRVILKGYGLTLGTYGDNTTGVLRTVDSVVVNIDQRRKRIDNNGSTSTEYLEDIHGACAGDSGGPLFKYVKGELVQFGVLSIGNHEVGGQWDGLCLGWNAHTDIRYYIRWILNNA